MFTPAFDFQYIKHNCVLMCFFNKIRVMARGGAEDGCPAMWTQFGGNSPVDTNVSEYYN